MKVSDKVVQKLRMLIEENKMQIGERLPAYFLVIIYVFF